MAEKQRWAYQGSVYQFNDIIARNWSGETSAASEKQAVSNLAFQYRRTHGLAANASIRLGGKPVRVR